MKKDHAFANNRPLRIWIADSDPNVRFALGVLLDQQPGFLLQVKAAGAKDLLSQVEADCLDVILLDWNLDGVVATELLASIRQACPDAAVIVLSGKPEIKHAALAAGADAFDNKTDPPEQLLAAIQSVAKPKRAAWPEDQL